LAAGRTLDQTLALFKFKTVQKVDPVLNIQSSIILAPEVKKIHQNSPKSFLGWGSTPDPAGGAHDTPPDPLVGWLVCDVADLRLLIDWTI